MSRVRVTRRVHFSAAHRLQSGSLSAAENARVYGLCNSPNYHGHNYELDITVEGEVDRPASASARAAHGVRVQLDDLPYRAHEPCPENAP